MAQFPRRRVGPDGCGTSMSPLGRGRWGARVTFNEKIIMQDNTGRSRADAARNLKALLRMVDKMGYDCEMASASRMRRR